MRQVGYHSRRIGFSHIYNILTCTNNYNYNSYSMKILHASTIDNEQTIVTIVITDCNKQAIVTIVITDCNKQTIVTIVITINILFLYF